MTREEIILYIKTNKAWIFSGIGVFFLTIAAKIMSTLFSKRSKRDENKALKASTNPQNNKFLEVITKFSDEAKKDCEALNIPRSEIQIFVKRESETHPKLFDVSFSSLVFPFGDNILLCSWDHKVLLVERIVSRNKAYQLNQEWIKCLSLYRKAAMLPYRNNDIKVLVSHTELKRTLNHFDRLVYQFIDYIKFPEFDNLLSIPSSDELVLLLKEIHLASDFEDTGEVIARLEILLSTIHKLLLKTTPQNIRSRPTETKFEKPLKNEHELITIPQGKLVFLIVEDRLDLSSIYKKQLERKMECFCICAGSGYEAIRYLVDYKFDIAILDIMLKEDCSNIDGKEVAIAIKKVSPKTKIIVCSGAADTKLPIDLISNSLAERWISKSDLKSINVLASEIKQLLSEE